MAEPAATPAPHPDQSSDVRHLAKALHESPDDDTLRLAFADANAEDGDHAQAAREKLRAEWRRRMAALHHAVVHGSLREEWAAADDLAAHLHAGGDAAIHYVVPFSADRSVPFSEDGRGREAAADVARRLRTTVSLERQRTEEAGGRRDRPAISLTLDRQSRPAGLLLPGRHYTWDGSPPVTPGVPVAPAMTPRPPVYPDDIDHNARVPQPVALNFNPGPHELSESIWKEVLCVGRQRDARGNWFEFNPADIRAAHANTRKMLSRGIALPCVWEHVNVEAGDPDDWKARYAKYTFGHIADSRINDRGNLDLLHVVPRKSDAEQLAVTRFVSPKVYRSYSDSRGGEYRGATIAHVASTPTPVQSWQRPFELSAGDALYLSYTPEESPVAKDDDKGAKTAADAADTAAAGKSGIGAVIEALKEVGFMIPDEVCDEQGLVIAIKAGGMPGKDKGDDLGLDDHDAGGKGGDDQNAPPAKGASAAGSPPMLMSATDPKAKAWAKADRRALEQRAKDLFNTGRVDRPTAEKLVRQVRAVELSYTQAGDPVAPAVQARIEAYEELPAGQAWSPTGRRDAKELSDARAVPVPDKLKGKDEGTTEATNLVLGLIPDPPKK